MKSRFKDGPMFRDIQFPLSKLVHLIVKGREVHGYAHKCICYACSLFAMHAGSSSRRKFFLYGLYKLDPY